MSQARIRAALEGRLSNWASIPVVWENVRSEYATDHLRAYLLPATTVSDDVAGDQRHYTGLFQVSVFTPAGIGPGRAETLAGQIATLFPVGLVMTSGGLDVRVKKPVSVRRAIVETDWYSVPVDFTYAAVEVLQ